MFTVRSATVILLLMIVFAGLLFLTEGLDSVVEKSDSVWKFVVSAPIIIGTLLTVVDQIIAWIRNR